MRTNYDFSFWRYDHAKLLKYIKNTLRNVWVSKDGTNDKYETKSLTVIGK